MVSLKDFFPPDHVPKQIASDRLVLRQYCVHDDEALALLLRISYDTHLAPWSPPSIAADVTPAGGHRAAREHILSALDKWNDGTDYRLFITLRETGEIIGQIGLTQLIRGISQSCSIGYWVGLPFINRGYATEAATLAMKFAFDVLKLHRITFWISCDNAASLRVMEKLGLRFEGTALRGLFLEDHWHDTNIYAITAEEWMERGKQLTMKFAPGSEHTHN